jgi:hypothetical protein
MALESTDPATGCCSKTSSQIVVDFPGSQGLPGDLPLDLLADEGADLILVDLIGCLKAKYPLAKTLQEVVTAIETEVCGTKKAADIVIDKPIDTCLLSAATNLQALVELLSKRSCPEYAVASGSTVVASSPNYSTPATQAILALSSESINPGVINGSTTYIVKTTGIFNVAFRANVKPQVATGYDVKLILSAKKLGGGTLWQNYSDVELNGEYVDASLAFPIAMTAGDAIYFDIIAVANNIATGALEQIPLEMAFVLRMAKQWAL